jgi:hypothetical protein
MTGGMGLPINQHHKSKNILEQRALAVVESMHSNKGQPHHTLDESVSAFN